jgi:DNA-binding NarL/FixJ family response regulator
LTARAAEAEGMALLATGDAVGALRSLLAAQEAWQQLGSPYEGAVTRLRLARVYDALGDIDAAAIETEIANTELARLGAVRPPDPRTGRRPDGLTSRELVVLDLLAAGRSNQEIAAELVLSVRTVERHLATVYRKLGLSGRSARAAAVRYALQGEIATSNQTG